MAHTETLQRPLDTVHPSYPRLRKSKSFKENATLFLNKFSNSLTASKSELQRPPAVRSTSSSRKYSFAGAKNAIKRRASTMSTDLKIDNYKNENRDDKSSLNDIEECSKDDISTDLSAKLKKIASSLSSKVTSMTISSNIVNVNGQFDDDMTDANRNIERIDNSQFTLKSNEPHVLQKSVSTPVKSTKKATPTDTHHHANCNPTSRYNWANGRLERVCTIQPFTPLKKVSSAIMLVESVSLDGNLVPSMFDFCNSSPGSSDDEDAIVTPFSCAPEDWPSSDSNIETIRSDTKTYRSKRKPRKNEDLTPLSTLSSYKFDTDINIEEIKFVKYGKPNSLDRLKRSSTIMSASSSESIASNYSTLSSSMFRRPSEFRRRESKAISMWYHTVQKLTQQNMFNTMNNMKKVR